MKDLLPKLVIGFMVATTAATSAYAGMKLVESPQTPIVASSNSPKENSLKSQIESKIESFGEMFQMPSFVHEDDNHVDDKKTTMPPKTVAIASSSTSSKATTNSNDCIITLFGKQYKINSLLNSHSGGNIFNCGTDMSSVYQGKHGTGVSRMAQYLISTTTSTVSTGQASSSTSSKATTNSNDCIITLFGKQYKINSLLNSHSGGNIFNCGSDMSSTYQGKHGTNVSRMAQYLITTSASTSTSNNSSTSTSSTASTTTNSNDCIVTLFGQQYKINSLLNNHGGGNIFNCGTDMTAAYQSKHGTNVSRMSKYAISSGGSTSGSGTSSSSSSGSKHDDDDDDDEGEREEDRYED